MKLRLHQDEIIDSARASFSRGNSRIILQASCGFGKTIVAASIADSAIQKGTKVLFLCHRRELCYQARDRFNSFGLDVGLILSGEEPDLQQDIQIATIQTYSRRIKLTDDNGINFWLHNAGLVIIDECHTAISPTYQKILKTYYADGVNIGLTATPCRGDGRGLGEYFDDIVSSLSFGGLIEAGFLVKYRYFSPAQIDLEKIKTVAGDYDKKELGHRMDKPQLIGDIFEQWAKIAGGRQTIIFAVNVKHSIHIKETFEQQGIRCEHIDAKTPTDERAQVLADLDNGNVQVITNVGILTEGFDCPIVDCIVLARPTKSYGLYVQMAGRGSRIYKNKFDCILLDHGGCIEDHGVLDIDVDWSLDGKKKAWSKRKNKTDDDIKTVKCRACNLVFAGSGKCPECGTETKTFGKKVLSADGELVEMVGKKKTVADKRRYLGMLKYWIPLQNNPNPARINGAFRGRFGCWPHHSYKYVDPIKPDQEFLSYMKSQAIRYAKRRTDIAAS